MRDPWEHIQRLTEWHQDQPRHVKVITVVIAVLAILGLLGTMFIVASAPDKGPSMFPDAVQIRDGPV